MSGTSSALAARLEKVFARVKARDFAGVTQAVEEYEREAREAMGSNYMDARISNELHVDLLKVNGTRIVL